MWDMREQRPARWMASGMESSSLLAWNTSSNSFALGWPDIRYELPYPPPRY